MDLEQLAGPVLWCRLLVVDTGRLDLAACRAGAEARFEVSVMAAGLETVYRDLC